MRILFALSASVVLVACSPHASTAGDADAATVQLLPDPEGGVPTWDGWTEEFMRDYCVQCHNPSAPCSGSGCHPTNGVLPDFRLEATVVGFAPMIRCGVAVQQDPAWQCGATATEQFPVNEGNNPIPTDDERNLIVEWVDAGCP